MCHLSTNEGFRTFRPFGRRARIPENPNIQGDTAREYNSPNLALRTYSCVLRLPLECQFSSLNDFGIVASPVDQYARTYIRVREHVHPTYIPSFQPKRVTLILPILIVLPYVWGASAPKEIEYLGEYCIHLNSPKRESPGLKSDGEHLPLNTPVVG